MNEGKNKNVERFARMDIVNPHAAGIDVGAGLTM